MILTALKACIVLRGRVWIAIAGLCVFIMAAIPAWQTYWRTRRGGEQHGLVFHSTEKNYGLVLRGRPVPFEFRFKNVGLSSVTIVDTTVGCACAEVKVLPSRIAPGRGGVVKGTIRFSRRGDNVQESIVIRTSDSRAYNLRLYGDVIEMYTVAPERLDFGTVYWDDILEGTVDISAASAGGFAETLELMPGHSTNTIDARLSCMKKGKWRLYVNVKTPLDESVYQRILLKTDSQNGQQIEIPVLAKVMLPVTVEPRTLLLGNVSEDEKVQREIVLETRPGLEVKDLRISASIIVVSLKRRQAIGNVGKMEVELDCSGVKGLVKDALVIETGSPKAVVHLPIIAFVSPRPSIEE